MERRPLLAAAGWLALVLHPARAQTPPLRIGITAVILADQAAFLSRWAEYLSQRMGTRAAFVARDEYQPILDLLLAREIDAAWICGYPYVRYQSQLQLLAVPVYQGRPQYQACLIRPRGGEVTVRGWADLRDKVFAFSDPLSNSGWLVAQGQLGAVGLSTSDLRRAFFAHGHRNVAEAVAARLADAGSIDGYVWETMRKLGMAAALQTEVVWQSPLHGFPPLVARASAAPETVDRLRQTLLAMTLDTDGRTLLAGLNLDGFTTAKPALFESIRVLARAVPGSGVSG